MWLRLLFTFHILALGLWSPRLVCWVVCFGVACRFLLFLRRSCVGNLLFAVVLF